MSCILCNMIGIGPGMVPVRDLSGIAILQISWLVSLPLLVGSSFDEGVKVDWDNYIRYLDVKMGFLCGFS